jgi:hypothetical protein
MKAYFSLRHCVLTEPGAHPTSYPVGTGGSFAGVKRPGREADHSRPSNAFISWCSVKGKVIPVL